METLMHSSLCCPPAADPSCCGSEAALGSANVPGALASRCQGFVTGGQSRGALWHGAAAVGGKRCQVTMELANGFPGNVPRRGGQSSQTEASAIAAPPAVARPKPTLRTVERSTNIAWCEHSVSKVQRCQLLNQKGCCLWLTGLSGSGKSTVACMLEHLLYSKGKMTYVLDGDNVRHGLNSNLSFSAEDRSENVRRTGEVAKLFADAGVITIASFISPYVQDREMVRARFAPGEFIEVHLDVPLAVCEQRDVKGLYKMARAGKIKGFTGVDDPYEAPLNPEVRLSSGTPDEMAQQLYDYLESNGFLVGYYQ